MERDCNIEIDVTIIINDYTKPNPGSWDDPGNELEIDFDVFVKNVKGELVILQDEIVLCYADELYDMACEMLADEQEAQNMEREEMKYEEQKELDYKEYEELVERMR